jgi:putative sterol carrier protein
MVMTLCSENCSITGQIFNAGMGYFNRAAVLTGPGIQVGDQENPPTPEMIRQNWDAIDSLEKGKEMQDANAAVFALISLPSKPTEENTGDAEGAFDVQTFFDQMADIFNADAAQGVNVVFQFNISGKAGGDWSCTIKDKTCSIEPGVHDTPNCTLIMTDTDFLDMMTGKLPAMQAYTSGKLRIEGDILKSQLIDKLFKI